jgi:hypothetical protein
VDAPPSYGDVTSPLASGTMEAGDGGGGGPPASSWDAEVQQLVEMGIDRERARIALDAESGDVAKACQHLW